MYFGVLYRGSRGCIGLYIGLCWGYIGIVENKMESYYLGLGFWC